MKRKRFTAAVAAAVCVFLLLTLAACGGPAEKTADETAAEATFVPLNDREQNILDQMGDDVQPVTDEIWGETVSELQAHCDEFTGEVYQLEGIFRASMSINGVDTPYVYRTMVNSGEKTELGMPLKYLTKELADGTWVRVTAIVNGSEYGGTTFTTLEVVAIETLAEAGEAELSWDGPSHHHS